MKIFLSYAHEQYPVAEEINVSLSVRGYDVFFDQSNLKPGVEYDSAIQEAIQRCDLFIFLISPESLKQGTYSLKELSFAKGEWRNPSGRVLPVMARPTLNSKVDAYLRAVTILYPQGNLAAEVAASADALLAHPEPPDVPPTGELQRERIAAYRGLWGLTKLLPKWPRARDVSYEDLPRLVLQRGRRHVSFANRAHILRGLARLSYRNYGRTAFREHDGRALRRRTGVMQCSSEQISTRCGFESLILDHMRLPCESLYAERAASRVIENVCSVTHGQEPHHRSGSFAI